MEVLVQGAWLAGKLLLKTLPLIILGIIFAELLTALRLTGKFSFLVKPLINFSHLRQECGASFLTAFISPAAANAMLAEYFNRRIIQKKELFIASMINSFPAMVMHWRALVPVLLPLLGLTGIIYFLLLILIGLLKTVFLMFVGRILLKKEGESKLSLGYERRPPLKEALLQSLSTSKKTIKRVILWMTPAIFISCILIKAGVFDLLALYLKGVASWLPIPPSGLGVVAAQLAGPYIAGCTVAASLMAAGEITSRGVILSLLIGDVLGVAVAIPRYLLPYYVGIFGLRVGIELMIISSALRSMITIGLIFAIAFMPGSVGW